MTPAKQRVVIIGLIVLGILVVGFFGLRTVHAFREFRGHHHPPRGEVVTDVELIRDWMTIPSIAKMYHVPPPVLFEAINVPPNQNEKKSLKDINVQYYPQASGIVLEKIKAAILAHQPPLPPDQAKTPTLPAIATPSQP